MISYIYSLFKDYLTFLLKIDITKKNALEERANTLYYYSQTKLF